ncbi:MAG: hypothetical protein AB7T14_08490 [Candidatus Methylacidiphilaceae bacterium]
MENTQQSTKPINTPTPIPNKLPVQLPQNWPVADGRVASGIASGHIKVLECREHKTQQGTIYGLHLSFGVDREIWCRTDKRHYFEAARKAMGEKQEITAQVCLDERNGKAYVGSMYLGLKNTPDSLLSRCPSCQGDIIAKRIAGYDELYRISCAPCGIKDEQAVYGNLIDGK